jgi:hypothetical protein
MVLTPEKEAVFEDLAHRFVDEGSNAWITGEFDWPRYEFLQWLRTHRPVVFHGTKRDDLDVLKGVRFSRDATAFGDQQAVYASDDPIWAMYFAVLRKGGAMNWTRNSCSRVGDRPPRYAFAVNEGALGPGLLADGAIYVLPSESFRSDKKEFGVIDPCHLVSSEPVTPLARMRITPFDFPFADAIFESKPGIGTLGFAFAHWRARRKRSITSTRG